MARSFSNLKKVRTHAYYLKLPSQWKLIHPGFHISLLEPVKTLTIPSRNKEPPPPIIIEEEEKWEVSQIVDSKFNRGKLWYLVQWEGFSKDPEKSTWEPAENLKYFLNLSRILTLYIVTSRAPILQELDHLWCLVGRGFTKCKSHSWYEPLEVFYPSCCKHHLGHSVSTLKFLDIELWQGFQQHFQIYGHFHLGKLTIPFLILFQFFTLSNSSI
ncbi:hypothetical protein O181_110765 [Austropuccinia psidii MF-1]|uniref:Chromo domain-containing protein n=1 Tax=Austropuccinia psidii MF-1 TaxID=1389203 RepID=A0A9Q3JX34_9BASI|nr:hypothetical protein [Austropuccinia psidii MF-1]